MKICQFFNQIICVSSVTGSSKEQIKLSTSAVCLKHYCYRDFISRFAVRLLSNVICRNFNHSRRRG